MPEVNTLKNISTPSAKLYNWNILTSAFELFGIEIDSDTKSLIVAGDRDMLIEVLKMICEAESRSFKKKRHGGGVDVDMIDNETMLSDAESCVEFLILSFCHSFSIPAKQAAGLLAQGGKYLAHIVAKGLKGDFGPVKIWLQEIYASTDSLCNLITNERESGSVFFVLSSLKPGILSKDIEVVQWTLRLLSRLVLDLSEKDLLSEVWKWFTTDSVLELCILGLKRLGNEIHSAAIDLLLQVGQFNFIEFFTMNLRNVTVDNLEYISLISEFALHMRISESDTIIEEINMSGVVGYWVELGLAEAEAGTGKNNNNRASGMSFLITTVTTFFSSIEESENLMNSVLGLINRTCRDESEVLKYISAGMLFYLFDFLAEKKSNFAPIVYRTLTFLLVETYPVSAMREFLEKNFVMVFRNNPGIPIGILLEPYVKKLQASDTALEVFDYEFLGALAECAQLGLKQGIQVIDIVGKYYLNEPVYAKASGVPFTHIASKFIQLQVMQDYLFVFLQYSLNLVLSTELESCKVLTKVVNPRGKKQKKPEEVPLEEKKQQRNRILDMASWVIQQWENDLNDRLKDLLLKTNHTFFQSTSKNCKSLLVVLELLGNTEDLLKEFHNLNPTLFPVEEEPTEKVMENYQLVPVIESLILKRKGNFPWERVVNGIENAKQKKMEKDNKIRESEIKTQRALEYKKKALKKQLEMRKVEQGLGKEEATVVYKEGIVHKYITKEEIVLREFGPADSDFEEGIRLMLSKHSRVFKLLFSKYSGTGFEKKFNGNPSFDLHAKRKNKLNDAEYIKIMKDFNVIPRLLSKEELRTIMRTYNHKIAKQAEQSYVDYPGFKGVFCQIAYFVYSRRPNDYSQLPPVVSLKCLLTFMRDFLSSKNENTEVFDEPDPGTGDKDIVRSLNKLLQKDPKASIPEGYEKIKDKEIKIFYSVPSFLKVPQSLKSSIEILDELFENLLGIRLLEPQVEYFETFRVKGLAVKKEKIDMPPIYERIEPVKKKPRETISPGPSKVGKLSSFLKIQLTKVPAKDKERYEECANVLEDVLHSVKLKMKRVINRTVKGGAQHEKLEALKERDKVSEEAKIAEDDLKRKARQEKLLRELNKAKEERQNFLREEEAKKKRDSLDQEYRKKELEEREEKEKKEKKRKLEEWNKKKEQEKLLDLEKKKKEDEVRLAEDAVRRNKERLENLIKEKEIKAKESKIEEHKKIAKEQREKEKKKERGIKQYLETKQKEDKKVDTKRENIMLLNNTEVKSCLNRNSEQIGEIFTFYLRQMGEPMPEDASIGSEIFTKFCLEFKIFSVLSQDHINSIFQFLTNKKRKNVLNDDEFHKSLVLIANKGKDNLDIEEIGVKPLEKMLEQCEISLPIKELKKKLNRLKAKIDPQLTKKKKTGLNLNRILGKKSPNKPKVLIENSDEDRSQNDSRGSNSSDY